MQEAVIYCRISSWSQADGHGLQRQYESCVEYCRGKSLEIVAVFSDVGRGDVELPGRCAAERIARNRRAALVCETPCRWARSMAIPMPENLLFAEHLVNASAAVMRGILDHYAQDQRRREDEP